MKIAAMLIRNDHIYRPESIEFQRRRLAGEVRLTPTKKLWIGASLFTIGVSAGVFALSLWSIPVELNDRCVVETPLIVRTVSGALPDGSGDRVERVRIEVSDVGAYDVRVRGQTRNADGTTRFLLAAPLPASALDEDVCGLTALLEVRPLSAALEHAWRRA